MNVAQKIANKKFFINGCYVNYGPKAYDWVYITSKKYIYKLEEGISKNGSLRWTYIPKSLFENIIVDFQDNSVYFGNIKASPIRKKCLYNCN